MVSSVYAQAKAEINERQPASTDGLKKRRWVRKLQELETDGAAEAATPDFDGLLTWLTSLNLPKNIRAKLSKRSQWRRDMVNGYTLGLVLGNSSS